MCIGVQATNMRRTRDQPKVVHVHAARTGPRNPRRGTCGTRGGPSVPMSDEGGVHLPDQDLRAVGAGVHPLTVGRGEPQRVTGREDT